MMEEDLKVNGQGLQETIESLKSSLTEMQNSFDEIRNGHSQLGASWKGEASDAALTKLSGLEDEGNSQTETLQNTIAALEAALEGYNKAEETISELWAL